MQEETKKTRRRQVINCSIEEFNETLTYLKDTGGCNFITHEPSDDDYLGYFNAFVWTAVTYVHVLYKDFSGKGKAVEKRTRLDGAFDGVKITGGQAFALLQQSWKAPEVNATLDERDIVSYGISVYRKRTCWGKRIPNCYGYDMNSAYPYGMLQPLPDTSKPLGQGIVKKDQYGFDFAGNRVDVGDYAKYRFPLMESPYKKFVEKYYSKKKNATNMADRNTFKFIMNAAIGAMQNHNWFLRAAILNNFHQVIEGVIQRNKDCIIASTIDSIVSTRRIPELDETLGNEIGQWKLEHIGDFAIDKNGYSTQWNHELPKYGCGKPRSWFKPGWDILVDPVPVAGNEYRLDLTKMKIVKQRKCEVK